MEEQIDINFSIADDLCVKTGMNATWKANQISLSAYKHVFPQSIDKPSEYANLFDVNIYHITPTFIFDDPILRSLINEANSVFLTVQNMKNSSRNDYAKISRTYRCIVRACLEKLNDEMKNETDTAENKYHHYITVFYCIECIWHLCEILFIDSSPSNVVVPQLLEWNRFLYPHHETNGTELLLNGREASNNDKYWPTIKGLIFQGQIHIARAILQFHASSETNAFRMTEQILKTIPLYNNYNGVSVQTFRSQRQFWLKDAEVILSSGTLSNEPYLEEIIQLITGNVVAWNEAIKNSENWYELLPGYLFYVEPTCKYFELGTLANCWLSRWAIIQENNENESNLKHLDRVILKLMENDVHAVLYNVQKMSDNQWFATHLTDLLYNSGQLQLLSDQHKNENKKLRDYLLFEFGSNLMSRESLWMIGLDYIEACSKEDRGAMQLLLLRVPMSNEKQVFKVINAARKKKILESIEPDICKIQSKKSMTLKRYGDALDWAIRSKDATYVTYITDYFLRHYTQTGELLCPDVIENIGAKMFISQRLVFLVKYYDFHQHYTRRDFIPASEILVSLLDSKITPEYFWPTLLIDSIPLLESKDQKLGSKETNIILHHLESDLVPLIEKRTEVGEMNMLRDYRVDKINEIIKLLRLAIARNLARSFIIETTVTG